MTTKIRITVATLAVALSFSAATAAVAPSDAHAVSAKPTGNAQQDKYCQGVARLIDEALDEMGRAGLRGDWQEYYAWRDHANEIIRRAQANGCEFTTARVTRLPGHVVRPVVKATPTLTG